MTGQKGNKMIKYLVKETTIATESNERFAGMESIAYYGKNQQQLALQGTANEKCHMTSELTDWGVKTFGYNRKCDAMRSWIYNNPENNENWKSKVDIVAIEV